MRTYARKGGERSNRDTYKGGSEISCRRARAVPITPLTSTHTAGQPSCQSGISARAGNIHSRTLNPYQPLNPRKNSTSKLAPTLQHLIHMRISTNLLTEYSSLYSSRSFHSAAHDTQKTPLSSHVDRPAPALGFDYFRPGNGRVLLAYHALSDPEDSDPADRARSVWL